MAALDRYRRRRHRKGEADGDRFIAVRLKDANQENGREAGRALTVLCEPLNGHIVVFSNA
jgi:hypothetical protein